MTLELVPWRGANVPVLAQPEVSRATVQDYLNWIQYSQYNMGAPTPVTTYGNRPAEPITNTFEGFVQGMLYPDGPVAAAEAYRLRVFGQAPILYQEMVDGRPGDLFDDEALDRLRKPWPGGNLGDLMKRILIYGDFGGNGFILDLDDELVLVRPDWVEFVLAKREFRGGQVGWRQVGIVYYEGGRQTNDGVPFLPGEYSHFVPGLPDPLANYRGMSWLTPLVREVQADKSAHDHKLAYFENAASANLAVSLPKEISPAQFEAFVEAMDSKHKGARNAYSTLYTAGGADVTVIGANMQQMDFSAVIGKGETRIANAAGVPPTLLSFSEGMQGSSLNAGNYTAAKRNFVDTTMRDLWANFAGSLQQMDTFQPREKARVWYDGRDIPFLHEDAKDLAEIQQTRASTINSYITAGFEPESATLAVLADDVKLLKHTGLTSVQLMPPGSQDADGDGVPDAEAEAADEYEAALDEFRSELVWHDEIVRKAPYPGQRYTHGWVPVVGMTGDALRLGGRMDLEPGESLAGSDRVDGVEEESSSVLLAATDGPRGKRLRVGVTLDEDKRSWTGRNRGGTVVLDEAGQARLRSGLAAMAERGAEVADRLKAIDRQLDDLSDRRAEIERRQYAGMTKKQSRELARLDADIELEERLIREDEANIASPPPNWDAGYIDYKKNGLRLQRQKLQELAARRAGLVGGLPRQPLSAADMADLAEVERTIAALNAEWNENYLDRILAEGSVDGEWGSVSWNAQTDDTFDAPSYQLYGPDDNAEPVVLTAAKLEELIRLLGQEVAQRSYIERRNYYGMGAGERVGAGNVGGGRFRKLSDQIIASLNDWLNGSDDDDPLEKYTQPQLKKAAEQLGVTMTPRASKSQLKLALLKDARTRFRADRDSEGDEPRQAKLTLSSPKYRDLDVGVYAERDGRVSLYRLSSTNARGSKVVTVADLDALEAWGRDNDEPQVASWAVSERDGDAPSPPVKKAPAKKAAPAANELAPGMAGATGRKRQRQREEALMGVAETGTLSVHQAPDTLEALESLQANGYVRQAGSQWRLTDRGQAYVDARKASERDGGKPAVKKAAPRKAPAKKVAPVAEYAAAIRDGGGEGEIVRLLDADASLTPTRLRELAADLDIDLPADARTRQRLQSLIATEASRRFGPGDGRLKDRAPQPAASDKLDPVEVADRVSKIDLGGDITEAQQRIVDALQDVTTTADLRRVATAFNLPLPRDRKLDAAGIRQYIAENMVRDRTRWALPGADPRLAAPAKRVPTPEPPAETAARTRQAKLDRARSVSGLLRDVDEFLTNGASDRALETRIRSRSEVAGTPSGLRDELLAPLREVEVENAIRAAYRDAIEGQGGPSPRPVSLADIRDRLAEDNIRNTELELALKRMIAQPGVLVIPESNQGALTPRQRSAAVRIGGQDKHHISLADPSPREVDRTRLRDILDRAARDEGLTPIGAAGSRTTFDPQLHEPLGDIRPGAPVIVSRQGHTTVVDGDVVAVEKAVVMADDGPAPAKAVPAPAASGKRLSANQIAGMPPEEVAQAAREGRVAPKLAAEHIRGFARDARRHAAPWAAGQSDDQMSTENLRQVRTLLEKADRLDALAEEIGALGAKTPASTIPDADPLSDLRTMDTESARDALDLRKVPELKALLKAEGLPVSGNKRALVDRLVEHLGGGGTRGDSPNLAGVSDPPAGRDISREVDYESLPTEYNLETNHDDALKEILHRQGFDAVPAVVSAADFDAAVRRGEVRETWRGLGTSRFTDLAPAEMAEQYRTGDLRAGVGINGNGTYVAMRRADGEYYGPTLLRIGLRSDARVITADDLDAEMDAYFATAPETTQQHRFREQELLDNLAKAKTPRARANIRRQFRADVYGADRRSRRLAIQRDPGRFAALRGYDAVLIPKERSPDKHAEMIILNRGATIVEAAQ